MSHTSEHSLRLKTCESLSTQITKVARLLSMMINDQIFFERRAKQLEQAKNYPELARIRSSIAHVEIRINKKRQELLPLQEQFTHLLENLQAEPSQPSQPSQEEEKKKDKIALLRRLLVGGGLYDLMDDDTLYHHYLSWCETHPRSQRTNRYVHMTTFLRDHPDVFRPMTPEEQKTSAMKPRA